MNRPSIKGSAALLVAIFCSGFVSFPAYGIEEQKLRTFLNGNDHWNVRRSPDGRHLSLLTQKDERNMLVVLDLKTMKPTTSVKFEEGKKIEITSAE